MRRRGRVLRRLAPVLVLACLLAGHPRITLALDADSLLCTPDNQTVSVTGPAEIHCVALLKGQPAEKVHVQLEVTGSSRDEVVPGEPPDADGYTDAEGLAILTYDATEAGKDEVCAWIDQDGKPDNIDEGDPTCSPDADTVILIVNWLGKAPPPPPTASPKPTKALPTPTPAPSTTPSASQPVPTQPEATKADETGVPVPSGVAPGSDAPSTPVESLPGAGGATSVPGSGLGTLVVTSVPWASWAAVVIGLLVVLIVAWQGPKLIRKRRGPLPPPPILPGGGTKTNFPPGGGSGPVPSGPVPTSSHLPIDPPTAHPGSSTTRIPNVVPSNPSVIPPAVAHDPGIDERRRRQLNACNFSDDRWHAPTTEAGHPAFHLVQGRTIDARMAVVRGGPPARLQGDYWHGTQFDVGEVDAFWLSDHERQTGKLTSEPAMLTMSWLTFLVGGGILPGSGNGRVEDLAVELWIREPTIPIPTLPAIPSAIGGGVARAAGPVDPGTRLDDLDGGVAAEVFEDGVYSRRLVSHPPNTDVMRRVNWDVTAWSGRDARIRVVDNATGGHITLADVRCATAEQRQPKHEVWGLADMHSHPMNALGFGKRLIAGSYEPHSHTMDDVGTCEAQHTMQGLEFKGFVLDNMFFDSAHGDGHHDGSNTYMGWPQFADGMHAQMHPEAIRRAYEGGLRLMVALAVHNEKLAKEFPAVSGQPLQSDQVAIHEQLNFWKDVCANNADWMEIADSPSDARRIIDGGRLAVILGAEVDRALGRYESLAVLEAKAAEAYRGLPLEVAVRNLLRDDLTRLWELGVRQINPIHLTDNAFGGMAIYEEAFNISNHNLRGDYLQIHAAGAGDGIDYRINEEGGGLTPAWLQQRDPTALGVAGAAAALGWLVEWIVPGVSVAGAIALTTQVAVPVGGDYHPPDYHVDCHGIAIPPGLGHRNCAGLNDAGATAMDELMKLGMLIDVDHMSQSAMERTIELAMVDSSLNPPEPYPLISAHASLRELSPRRNWADRDRPNTPGERRSVHAWPSETEKSDAAVARLRATGGMIGPITSHLISLDHTTGIGGLLEVLNDCAGSSKTWAQEFLRARSLNGGRFTGLGTDMGLTIQIAPRFGPRAAFTLGAEYHVNTLEIVTSPYLGHARTERREQMARQANGVRYSGLTPLRADGMTPYPEDDVWPSTYAGAWRALDAEARGLRPSEAVRAAARTAALEQQLAAGLVAFVPPQPEAGFLVTSLSEATRIQLGLTAGSVEDARSYGPLAEAAFLAGHGTPRGDDEGTSIALALQLWGAMAGVNQPLMRAYTGRRDWDFNVDGLAHYGLLPDFMQDLANVGMQAESRATLFRSAEDFIQVWERCYRTRRVNHPDSTPPEYEYNPDA